MHFQNPTDNQDTNCQDNESDEPITETLRLSSDSSTAEMEVQNEEIAKDTLSNDSKIITKTQNEILATSIISGANNISKGHNSETNTREDKNSSNLEDSAVVPHIESIDSKLIRLSNDETKVLLCL